MMLNFIRRAARCKTVGVRALIFDENNSVLLVKHTYRAGWHTPGGGVNSGECPTDAIVREVAEETGLHIESPTAPFAIYLNKWKGMDDYPILYIARVSHAAPNVNDSAEISSACWFPIDHLPSDTTWKTRMRIDEAMGRTPISKYW